MNAHPPGGAVPGSRARVSAAAQLDAKVACAAPDRAQRADGRASFPDMRARSRPGTAIAAMMPMIATTISSSMSVKPFCVLH